MSSEAPCVSTGDVEYLKLVRPLRDSKDEPGGGTRLKAHDQAQGRMWQHALSTCDRRSCSGWENEIGVEIEIEHKMDGIVTISVQASRYLPFRNVLQILRCKI